MNKNIWIVIIVVVLIGGFVFINSKKDSQYSASQSTSKEAENQDQTSVVATSSPTVSTSTSSVKLFSLIDISAHKDKASCWTTINDGVYDLTNWIGKHPGGEAAILSICGKDGTAAFTKQHDSNPKQASILATFKIGNLK